MDPCLFVVCRKTIELPGLIGTVFEQVWGETDSQAGVKCCGRHEVIAALEQGCRLPVDRSLFPVKACVLVVEMATGITKYSAIWKKTLVSQQGLPSFLDARCKILARNRARRP